MFLILQPARVVANYRLTKQNKRMRQQKASTAITGADFSGLRRPLSASSSLITTFPDCCSP